MSPAPPTPEEMEAAIGGDREPTPAVLMEMNKQGIDTTLLIKSVLRMAQSGIARGMLKPPEDDELARAMAVVAASMTVGLHAGLVVGEARGAAEVKAVARERDEARAAFLNSKGDDLCWFDPASPKIPPREEFLESCSRFHQQISAINGMLSGCKTIAQLELEVERLTEALRQIAAKDFNIDTETALAHGLREIARDTLNPNRHTAEAKEQAEHGVW